MRIRGVKDKARVVYKSLRERVYLDCIGVRELDEERVDYAQYLNGKKFGNGIGRIKHVLQLMDKPNVKERTERYKALTDKIRSDEEFIDKHGLADQPAGVVEIVMEMINESTDK